MRKYTKRGQKKTPAANWKSAWPTTFRPRYANRARGNAPTIIPGTRATKPSSAEKRAARRQKVRAYGGVVAAAVVAATAVVVVDRGSGKKSRTTNVVKIREGPTNRAHCVHPANNTVAARATDAFSHELGSIVGFFKLYF